MLTIDPQATDYYDKAALLIKNVDKEIVDTPEILLNQSYCDRLELILHNIGLGNKLAPVPGVIVNSLLNHIRSYSEILDTKDLFLKIVEIYKKFSSGISQIALVNVYFSIWKNYLSHDHKSIDVDQLTEKDCEEILNRKLGEKNIDFPIFSGGIKDFEQALINFPHIPFHSQMAFFLDANSLSEKKSIGNIIPLIVRKNNRSSRYEIVCTDALGHSPDVKLLIDKLVDFVSKKNFGIDFYSCSMKRTTQKYNSSVFALNDIYFFSTSKISDFDLYSFATVNCVKAEHFPSKFSTYIFNILPLNMMKLCQRAQIAKSLEKNSEFTEIFNDLTKDDFQQKLEKYSFYTYQDGLPIKVNVRAEIKKMRYVAEILEKQYRDD